LKPKARKFLQILLRLLVSSLALYVVLRKTDLHSLYQLLLQCNPFYLLAACAFFIFSKILSAIRLNLFFRATGINLLQSTNLRLYWLGMFYNLFLPGGIGGDGYKVYYLNRKMQAPVKKSLLALVFDRVTGLLAIFLLCLLFAMIIPQTIIRDIYFLLTMMLGSMVFYFIVYRWFKPFFGSLHRTNLQSLGVQLAQVIAAWLILRALHHEQLTTSYLFVFLISSVVAVIPFTIGGVGAREITFLYAADILQLDLAAAVSLSLLFFLITALVSLAGGWYVIRPGLIGSSVSENDAEDVTPVDITKH
jgi:hypothetical protein